MKQEEEYIEHNTTTNNSNGKYRLLHGPTRPGPRGPKAKEALKAKPQSLYTNKHSIIGLYLCSHILLFNILIFFRRETPEPYR